MKKKKGLKTGVAVLLLASSLSFGAIGAGATTNNSQMDNTSVVATTASTETKKQVFTYSSNFNKKTVSNKMKKEAVILIKTYADSLNTGKVTAFNKYVDKRVYEADRIDWAIGTKYNKDEYKDKIQATRKANKKADTQAYSKALKKVTQKTLTVEETKKDKNRAMFQYSYQPKGWNALSSVYITFHYKKLENGKYVLEKIHFY